MVVGYLSIDIKSINIIQVYLDSTSLFKITYLVKSRLQLIVVAIVLPNGILDVFTRIEPILVRLPPLQRISFCTKADVSQPLYLVASLCNGQLITHLKDPSFLVLHVPSEFGRGWYFSCYHSG